MTADRNTAGRLRCRLYYRLMLMFGMGRVNRFHWKHSRQFRAWWGEW